MSQIARVLKCFLFMMIRELVKRFTNRSLHALRLNTAKFYVQSVEEVRRLVLGLIAVLIGVAVIASGCVLVPIGAAIIIYDRIGSLQIAGIIVAAAGMIFLIFPIVLVRILTSERLWFRLFRVARVVELAADRKNVEGSV